MKYVQLGRSGLTVSAVCLGGNAWGAAGRRARGAFDLEGSKPFFKTALDAGITFFDTADACNAGESERIIGAALLSYAPRDEVVISTKIGLPMSNKPNDGGLRRKHLVKAIDAALQRLGTDHVDLLQVHRLDGVTPLEETMQTLRQAISLSINRQAIVDRVMHGHGEAAGQLSPAGLWGTSPNLRPDPFDPDRARRLLTEAGWGQGLGITLHCTADRLPNDGSVCTALGGMLTRIGIRTTVAATPRAVFFPASARFDYSLQMSGWGSLSGETSYILTSLVHSRDEANRLGGNNRTMYSNPRLDAQIQRAVVEMDDERRKALLMEAMEIAIGDYSTIPVVTLDVLWGARRDRVSYIPRKDEETNVLMMRRVVR